MLMIESKVGTSRVGIFMGDNESRQHIRANSGVIVPSTSTIAMKIAVSGYAQLDQLELAY